MDQITPQPAQPPAAPQPFNPTSLAYQPPKHSKKKFFIIIAGIVVIAVGSLFVVTNNLQKGSDADESGTVVQVSAPPALEENINAPVRGIENLELDPMPVFDMRGFSMNIPKDWKQFASLEQPCTGAGYIHIYDEDDESMLGIFVNITPIEGTSIEKLFEEDKASIKANKEVVVKVSELRNFKHMKAGFHEAENPTKGTTAYTITTYKHGRVYTVGLQSYTKDWEKYKPLYLKVLDTIKFDENPTPFEVSSECNIVEPIITPAYDTSIALDSELITDGEGFSASKPKGWINEASEIQAETGFRNFYVHPEGKDKPAMYLYVMPQPEMTMEQLHEIGDYMTNNNSLKLKAKKEIIFKNFTGVVYESESQDNSVSNIVVFAYKNGVHYRFSFNSAPADWEKNRPLFYRILDTVKLE